MKKMWNWMKEKLSVLKTWAFWRESFQFVWLGCLTLAFAGYYFFHDCTEQSNYQMKQGNIEHRLAQAERGVIFLRNKLLPEMAKAVEEKPTSLPVKLVKKENASKPEDRPTPPPKTQAKANPKPNAQQASMNNWWNRTCQVNDVKDVNLSDFGTIVKEAGVLSKTAKGCLTYVLNGQIQKLPVEGCNQLRNQDKVVLSYNMNICTSKKALLASEDGAYVHIQNNGHLEAPLAYFIGSQNGIFFQVERNDLKYECKSGYKPVPAQKYLCKEGQ